MVSHAHSITLLRNPASARLHRACAASVFALTVVLSAACERAPSPSAGSTPPAAISQAYTLGADPASPEVSIRLRADRSRMTVAERLTLVLTIDAENAFRVSWPLAGVELPAADRLGDFTIAAATTRPLPGPPGRTITEHTLVLEPFLEGAKRVPSLTFDVRAAAGTAASRAITTQPLEIQVSPVLAPDEAQTADLAPPAGPIAATLPPIRGNILLAAGALTALTAWLGAFAWARISAGRRVARIDPVAVARGRLAEIRSRLAAMQADPFGPAPHPSATSTAALAAGLGVVIREYLEHHLHIPAMGATAAELAPRLAASRVPPDLQQPVVAALAFLEQAAFSPPLPAQPRCADLSPHLDLAERLVESTAAITSREVAA